MAANDKTNGKAATPSRGINEWMPFDHAPECPWGAAIRANKAPTRERDAKGKPLVCAQIEGFCCPNDLVVNAGVRPLILQALARIPNDNPRIDVGDRRRGPYYVGLAAESSGGLGIARLLDIDMKRAAELEKSRQVRTGERPADWQVEAMKKLGTTPNTPSDKLGAMDALARAGGYAGVE
jgi:hypothetical protein